MPDPTPADIETANRTVVLYMRHPDITGPPAQTTREAFDLIHASKGWTLIADDAAAARTLEDETADAAARMSAVVWAGRTEREFDRGQLEQAAAARGLDPDGTKAQLLARLRADEADGA